jgi:hypothetical protein
MRAIALTFVVAGCAALAGCGGKGKESEPGTRASLPACAHAGRAVASGLPASFRSRAAR